MFEWIGKRPETGEDEAPDIGAERARLAKEQADAQALKNAAMRSELLPADEVVAGWQDAIGRCRALLLGIPPASSATLVLLARGGEAECAERAIRAHLTRVIDHALNELADTSLDDLEDEDGG